MGLLDLIGSAVQASKQNKLNQRMVEIQEEVKNLDPVKELEKYKVTTPNIRLEEDEECYYEGTVYPFKLKQRVARSSQSKGVSVKIMSGLWYHSGGSASDPVIQEYCDASQGTLFITNRRYVVTAPKYGFNVKIPKIINMQIHEHGFELNTGNRCHMVNGYGGEEMYRLIQVMNAVDAIRQQEEKDNPNPKPKTKTKTRANTGTRTKSISPNETEEVSGNSEIAQLKLLREYKSLYDEGIITEEEFNLKKKEILGL